MALTEYVRRIVLLNNMIEQGNTGTLKEIGRVLGVKERQASKYIRTLAELGKPSVYKTDQKSFVYKEGARWNIKWPRQT